MLSKQFLTCPVLSGPEFSHLFLQWKQGDETCRERIILAHLSLVAQLTQGEDQFQTGVLAFIESLDTFESGSFVAFKVYVTRQIQRAVTRMTQAQTESRERFPQGWQNYQYESEETVN